MPNASDYKKLSISNSATDVEVWEEIATVDAVALNHDVAISNTAGYDCIEIEGYLSSDRGDNAVDGFLIFVNQDYTESNYYCQLNQSRSGGDSAQQGATPWLGFGAGGLSSSGSRSYFKTTILNPSESETFTLYTVWGAKITTGTQNYATVGTITTDSLTGPLTDIRINSDSGSNVTADFVIRGRKKVSINTTGVEASGITEIVSLTQAEYDALTPDASKLYFIRS